MRAATPELRVTFGVRRVLAYTSEARPIFDPHDKAYDFGPGYGPERQSLIDTLPEYSSDDHKEACSFHSALAAAYNTRKPPRCTNAKDDEDPAAHYWLLNHLKHSEAAELHRRAAVMLLHARGEVSATTP